jgi:hypothetical protein
MTRIDDRISSIAERPTRRQLLRACVGQIATFSLAAGSARAAQANTVDLGAQAGADPNGVRDSTAALQAALATGQPVYVPPGTFVIDSARLPAGAVLQGPGVLKQKRGAQFLLTGDSGSADPRANLQGITLRDLTLQGTVEEDGFLEFFHLVALHGVTGLRVMNVRFVGFRGDGLYLGSGSKPGLERHNRDVTVRGCLFDGINRNNRNGISVIDCDGLVIENCDFRRCTNERMPGPIDLEPNDHPWPIIRRVSIRGNRFLGNGGISGNIGCYIPAPVTAMPEDILIERNRFEDYRGSGADVTVQFRRRISKSDSATRLRILSNEGTGGFRPLRIYSGRDVLVEGNRWRDYAANAQIGHLAPTNFVMDITVGGNSFVRCGGTTAGPYGLTLFTVDGATIEGNDFIDCGNGAPGSYALQFNVGTSRRVSVSRNRFSSPTGRTLVATVIEAKHRMDVASARFSGNKFLDSIRPGNGPGR